MSYPNAVPSQPPTALSEPVNKVLGDATEQLIKIEQHMYAIRDRVVGQSQVSKNDSPPLSGGLISQACTVRNLSIRISTVIDELDNLL